jgi:hypothetical protein
VISIVAGDVLHLQGEILVITQPLAAQIPVRELAIAAYELGMTDASKAEIAKACILVRAGRSPAQAKAEVLALRKPVEMSAENRVFSVKVPKHWLDEAIGNTPGLSMSELFRYSVARISESHEDALMRAKRTRGRPRKQIAA